MRLNCSEYLMRFTGDSASEGTQSRGSHCEGGLGKLQQPQFMWKHFSTFATVFRLSSSLSNWNFKFKFLISECQMPFHHHYSFLVYLIAGLCEGHYRNALVQAAQLAIPFALHTALWHSALLQRRGQYAVSILAKRERESIYQLFVWKHIHKMQPSIRQIHCCHWM